LAVLLPLGVALADQALKYPPARKAETVDVFHGTRVSDPYRWLENADAPETVAWVDAENNLTHSMLARSEREPIRKRIADLVDFPRVSVPFKEGRYYFVNRNTGLQNQSVLFVRDGLQSAERLLLDPNALSADGTVAVTNLTPTLDGTLLGYALSKSGSDQQEIYVRDVASGKDRPDHLQWAKFTTISWTPDNAGFYYERQPEPGSVPKGDENYFSKIYYHHLGDAQAKDVLVFEMPEDKEVVFSTAVSRDGRYVMISGNKGASSKAGIWILDRQAAGAKPQVLFKGFDDGYAFVAEDGGRFFFMTDKDAPLWRVIRVDIAKGSREAVTVIPQAKDRLSNATIVGHRLVAEWLHNASDRVTIHGLDGTQEKELALPGIGSVGGLTGEPEDEEMFLGFNSFTAPLTPYRYDFKTGALAAFETVKSKIDSEAYETEQVWCTSKDGTKVPIFLIHKKGLPKDGARPTVLGGYGGFNVSLTPNFSSARYVWLERGGIYAIANLRGGGEFGEAWHQAGMLDRKQNVFDDFIAAAQWLISSGYTRRDKLAILGGSNGGLLVGAVMVQRPDLVGAVVCEVPVADMLRYHLFTVGRLWIPEYGSADDPKQFPFLYRYSPYHNVKDGTAYPAALVTTADTDDRVAPGLAKKFAARLQEAQAAGRPILIRVETKAGHGGGKPLSKQIEEQADIYTFLSWQLGVGT
jgi:prolyl oligopeptidase